MPDWSYRTVFQPLLFLFPAETGRDLALNAMGRLSRFPFGSTVIDLMGHMRPDRRLSQTEQGLDISGPVMIGHQVDPHGTATEALARFGVGLIEVGPIARQAIRAKQPVELNIKPVSYTHLTLPTSP
jgi:dihydroorotate dehydrogenase